MNSSIFVDKEKTQSELLRRVEKLDSLLSRVTVAINQNGTVLYKGSYQLLVNLLKPADAFEKMLYGDLLKTAFQLDIKCQGAGYMFLKAFAGFAKEHFKTESTQGYQQHIHNAYKGLSELSDKQADTYWTEVLRVCSPASQELLDGVVSTAVGHDSVLETVVKEAMTLAGLEGTITLEETDNTSFSVGLQYGYNFPINPYNGFVPKFGTYERFNAKVLLVDGVIEKVSELDGLLRKSAGTGVPLLLIAQGFDEEVVATLYSNLAAGRLDVVPVKLEQSLETLNFLVDIAAACNGDILSTLKGESLVFADYDLLPTVDKVSITSNVLTVHNNSSRARVCAHLNYLEGKRQEQNEKHDVSDVSSLTVKRIQNLQAHVVKVGIPKSESNKLKPKLDNAIRAVRAALTYGFYNPKAVNISQLNSTWCSVHEQLVADIKPGELIPTASLYLAMLFASKLAGSYFTAAGAVMPA